MDRTNFYAALNDNPYNWDLRLVFADWLEEQGDEVAAIGQRWMTDNKVVPILPQHLTNWCVVEKAWFPANVWDAMVDVCDRYVPEYSTRWHTRQQLEADISAAVFMSQVRG